MLNNTDHAFSPQDLEEAAISLCHALVGKYKDLDGNVKSVGGDMTKLRYVDNLSDAAKRLMQNMEHVSRTIPGSQEVRRLMRFDTQAFRVRYGVPIFVTWSPDEKQSALFFRMSRTRESDPALLKDSFGKSISGRLVPPFLPQELNTNAEDDVVLSIPIADLRNALPPYDERRALIARDPLASVDGFRVIMLLTYEYLFGMRVCPKCPHCSNADHTSPCQDFFGSNAKPRSQSSEQRCRTKPWIIILPSVPYSCTLAESGRRRHKST